MARRSFLASSVAICRNNLAPELKSRSYTALVTSTLLYGSEAWERASAHRAKLTRFHNHCCSRMPQVSRKEQKAGWISLLQSASIRLARQDSQNVRRAGAEKNDVWMATKRPRSMASWASLSLVQNVSHGKSVAPMGLARSWTKPKMTIAVERIQIILA